MSQHPANKTFRELKILYYAMLAGMLIFFTVVFNVKMDSGELHPYFKYIVATYCIGMVVLAPILYTKLLKARIRPTANLNQKLLTYRSTGIVKYALLQGAALFTIVIFMITGNMIYAYLFIAVLVSFLMHRPTPTKCIHDLHLEGEERRIVEQF